MPPPLRISYPRAASDRYLAALRPRQADWFRIENRSPGVAEIHIYDEIGWFGTSAASFIDQLRDIADPALDVHINSTGGDVFDGIAIFNALRSHPSTVTTYVDSAALSIASVIAQGGDRRVMLTGSQMMIHDAWGLVIGPAADMRQYADVLDKQTRIIAELYAERSDGDVEEFLSLMAAESWFNAEESVALGLADVTLRPPSTAPPSVDPPAADPPAADPAAAQHLEPAAAYTKGADPAQHLVTIQEELLDL